MNWSNFFVVITSCLKGCLHGDNQTQRVDSFFYNGPASLLPTEGIFELKVQRTCWYYFIFPCWLIPLLFFLMMSVTVTSSYINFSTQGSSITLICALKGYYDYDRYMGHNNVYLKKASILYIFHPLFFPCARNTITFSACIKTRTMMTWPLLRI